MKISKLIAAALLSLMAGGVFADTSGSPPGTVILFGTSTASALQAD